MEIEGKIVKVLDQQTGVGTKGTWIKTLYLLETFGQFPREICLTVWGDDIQLNTGITVLVSVDISSREYNGKYYTDVKVWKAKVLRAADNPVRTTSGDPIPEPFRGEGPEDDLPF